MKIPSRAFVLPVSLILSLSLLLSGCGKEAPTKDPNALLQQAVYNLYGISSLRYKIDLGFTSTDTQSSKEASLDLALNGAVSSVNSVKSGSELSAVVKINDKAKGEYRFDVSVKSFKATFYFKLLSLPTIPGFPLDGLSSLVGGWWQVDMKQFNNFQLEIEGLDSFGASYDKLDELGKKKRDLILNSKFFKDMEFDGEEDLNGRKVYKYDMTVDVDGVVKYLQDLAVLDGEESGDPTAFNKFLTDANLKVSLWIDSLNIVLMKGELEGDSTTANTAKIEDLRLTFSVSDLNQPFSIETPSDYKVFDLGAFFGAFLGAVPVTPTVK